LLHRSRVSGKANNSQKPNLLTSEQVLSWLSYYGQPLDKDISQAVSLFGEPDRSHYYGKKMEPLSEDRLSRRFRGHPAGSRRWRDHVADYGLPASDGRF